MRIVQGFAAILALLSAVPSVQAQALRQLHSERSL
jgi:hypothetical protein